MKKLVALALFLVVCFGWLVAPLVADGDPTWPQPIKSATSPEGDGKTDAPTTPPDGDDGKSLTSSIVESLGLDPFIEIALVTLIEG